jgi:predicted dehydrogenase
MTQHPESIAIAGAWGYIGRKFVDAAQTLGMRIYVHDPGPAPTDIDLETITRIEDEDAFYHTRADLFHLAVHPEHRHRGEEILFMRAAREPVLVLNEKPMAAPGCPEQCDRVVREVERSGVTMLYDFPELYDGLTEQIIQYLSRFRDLRISELAFCRSKDREDRDIARNYKRMVTIQYQEAVHCLAFVLYLLGRLQKDLATVLDQGVSVAGESEPYDPPNPEIYPYVVDGRCKYSLSIGEIRVDGLTDFKANAAWAKERVISGVGDGRPFRIEVDYLEGEKRLAINGEDRKCDPKASSYRQVITTMARWYRQVPNASLMRDAYPNPEFARVTYQLSSALWRSCQDGQTVRFTSLNDLLAFDAGFAADEPSFPKYS